MKTRLCIVAIALVAGAAGVGGQEREDRTLLSHAAMRAIINEASGDRAVHAVMEMVPYPRVRDRDEYSTHFRETAVIAKLAKEFGFSNVEIESFPQGGRTWHASQAELWVVEPQPEKLYDLNDILVSIASGSETGDVTGELVDVGSGTRAEDYAGKDVTGRIVLGSGSAGQIQQLAVFDRGAAGVLSYNALRGDELPDQLMSQSVSAAPQGKKTGFGWSIAPRQGRDLAARLGRGDKVKIRSVVTSESFPGEMEMVHAVIPGDGTSDQAVMVTGHLYEGYTKQGANDDNSGCALSLEMGRAYIRLLADGKLPKPKRAIHFLWVPEISGTAAWLRAHDDVKKRLIADLNFDMEGLTLKLSGSAWVMHRTPDSLPTFLNDLCASVLKYVAELNRERVRYRSVAYGFTLPVVSQNGSRDPFFVIEDKYYGASDHVVFIGQGIPAVMFITWPDHYYHSSQDTPDKLDPTQMKRAAVVGIGSMSLVASAGDEMALNVAAESLARGAERMGEAQRKGLSYLADLSFNLSLAEAYREAKSTIRHQAGVERAVVKSAATLFADPVSGARKLSAFDALIDQRAAALQNEVTAVYRLKAEQMKQPGTEPAPTELERKAALTLVEPVPPAGDAPAMGVGGGRGGQSSGPLTPAMQAMADARRRIPGHITGELGTVMRQQKTVLEIRDFISGEFEPVPLQDVVDYLKAAEALGQIKLVEKPADPIKGKKPATAKKEPR
ncbi:MAG: M28 family peptidase [Acidobacteria bacterium]|nr:M28 family peptidase [Acidobacteriota bacterium]